jgi:multiple sugar transport system ATP-binding protein
MTDIRYDRVWKLFGGVAAVSDFSLEIREGEFLVFVGPSGCGKTTLLRMLAGLERPSHGRIWMGDQDVTDVPPGRRDVAMVFQSYALYPNMNVYKNLAFGPKVRKEPRGDVDRRVNDVADILGIRQLLDRSPAALSGGQRQRVALGRALIREPRLFLMDEPLSNLDAALRVQMRAELIRLHSRLEMTTTVYVTHDQVEALTMGDRVAVCKDGVLQQVDSPDNLYEYPTNSFVGEFIGSPRMNLISGTLDVSRGQLECLGMHIDLPQEVAARLEISENGPVLVGIRPHDLHLAGDSTQDSACFSAVTDVCEHTGTEVFATVALEDLKLVARLGRMRAPQRGQLLNLAFSPERLYLFDVATQTTLLGRPSHEEAISRRPPPSNAPSGLLGG